MLISLNSRYSRRLRKAASERGKRMAKARWDKWRADSSNRPEPEPKMLRWCRFEYGVRDKATGETQFRDLVSIRQASKALSLILKFL
jgi:hypothetical protein